MVCQSLHSFRKEKIFAIAGVLGNRGTGHALVHPFSVFGYHVTGSEGRLFLYGIVIGAAVMAGLTLLLAAARRTSRRGGLHLFGRQSASRHAVAVPPEPVNGQVGPDAPPTPGSLARS
jgi:hypothetical protein